MAALTQARMPLETRVKNISLPFASGSGQTAYVGGMACLDNSAHLVKVGAASNANLLKVGEFLENVDNSTGAASTTVMVSLDREIVLRWYDSATAGNAVTASNLFTNVYILDDHTVTTSSSGNSVAGRVWVVDSVKGIGVQAINLY